MDEIKIFSICSKEEVEKAAGLLTESVVDAMLKGLPVTTLLTVTDELAAMFVKLVYALKENCAPEMRIAMLAMNDENRRFINRFFDKAGR